MRERVDKLVGFGAESIWVSTFHSTLCADFAADTLTVWDMTRNFTIYDTDDQKTLMKDVCKQLQNRHEEFIKKGCCSRRYFFCKR